MTGSDVTMACSQTRTKVNCELEGYNSAMFTGIIRHAGRLTALTDKQIEISCPSLAGLLAPGDSVAVNGVCLTVVKLSSDAFGADLLDATLRATSFSRLPVGRRLNLEAPLNLGDSIGGHLISGHVDTTGTVAAKVWSNRGDYVLTVTFPPSINRYMIAKGSIAIDGVSLTIQQLEESQLTVNLIPETVAATSLGELEAGDSVNIEVDMMVKAITQTVERILAMKEHKE